MLRYDVRILSFPITDGNMKYTRIRHMGDVCQLLAPTPIKTEQPVVRYLGDPMGYKYIYMLQNENISLISHYI